MHNVAPTYVSVTARHYQTGHTMGSAFSHRISSWLLTFYDAYGTFMFSSTALYIPISERFFTASAYSHASESL